MRTPPELIEFTDSIGEFIKYWGFKKVDGSIWAHIFLAAQPISAKDIMERMKISKAQVSISIKELLKYGVIEESGKGEYGTTFYKSSDDLGSVIKGVLRQREKKMLAEISSSGDSLKDSFKFVNMEKWVQEERLDDLMLKIQLAKLFLCQLLMDDSALDELNLSTENSGEEGDGESSDIITKNA